MLAVGGFRARPAPADLWGLGEAQVWPLGARPLLGWKSLAARQQAEARRPDLSHL